MQLLDRALVSRVGDMCCVYVVDFSYVLGWSWDDTIFWTRYLCCATLKHDHHCFWCTALKSRCQSIICSPIHSTRIKWAHTNIRPCEGPRHTKHGLIFQRSKSKRSQDYYMRPSYRLEFLWDNRIYAGCVLVFKCFRGISFSSHSVMLFEIIWLSLILVFKRISCQFSSSLT